MANNSKCGKYSAIGYKGKVGLVDKIPAESIRKGDIIISAPFPFVKGKPQSMLVDAMAADSITITNTTSDEVLLQGMRIDSSNIEDSFILSLIKPLNKSQADFQGYRFLEDRILGPFQTLTIWLICCPKEVGAQKSTVSFSVGDDRIELVVFLLAKSGDTKAMPSEKPQCNSKMNKKNTEKKKNATFNSGTPQKGVGGGSYLPKKRKFKLNRLEEYPILKEVREFVASNRMPEFLMNGLSTKNYASYFGCLVILEELCLEEEMKGYDMKLVRMKERNSGRLLSLEVPGLAMGRPSLVPDGIVYAELATRDYKNGAVYDEFLLPGDVGTIQLVDATSICIKFSKEFHRSHSNGNLYNISFSYNRVNFRRIYQAIAVACYIYGRPRLLFPSESGDIRMIQPTKTEPISDALNEEQRRAVNYILGCSGGVPYIIYGPPGTGKTKTLVELILQLYKTKPNSRILVCTSSNCAADHILERIIVEKEEETVVVKEDEILRLNAKSRPVNDVDPELIEYCYVEDSVFECPDLMDLQPYRIIVSSYSSSHLLYEMGIGWGYFSNIILDEAGQATEPETMIPIANFAGRNTTVVLAGDPKQLGPVIKSKEAERYGLGKSYLERLCESELYREGGDPNYVTMLVRNYRCHPEILSLPSKMFYDDKLIAAKAEINSPSALPWGDMLLNRDFPVIFYGVEGQNMKERSNPSWFNRAEIWKVIRIAKKLVARKVCEQDIGVIAPYKQQVMKIKSALGDIGLNGIQVGSVEQFQGQEKEVIIVSTVRSTIRQGGMCRLGFLSSPKRFNVAVTRARSLLVIVGNPHTLSKDPCWGRLLWHCVNNGSFQGCGLPKRKNIDSITWDKCSATSAMGDDTMMPHSGDWVLDNVQKRLNHLSIDEGEDLPEPVTNEED